MLFSYISVFSEDYRIIYDQTAMLKMICCIDLRLYFENDVLEGVEDGAGLEVGLAYQLVLTDLETDFLASFNVWLVKFLSHSVKSKMEVLNFWADAVSA